jgi:hypothetical protein
MKHLIGPWWLLMDDPVSDVSEKALEAFQKAIPPKKRASVTVYLSSSILAFLQNTLSTAPEQMGDTSSLTAEEAEERYDRVIFSTIVSVGRSSASLLIRKTTNCTLCGKGMWIP